MQMILSKSVLQHSESARACACGCGSEGVAVACFARSGTMLGATFAGFRFVPSIMGQTSTRNGDLHQLVLEQNSAFVNGNPTFFEP